jgi:HAD superfamily phosphoserine phosphatase-like hydrolase
VLVSRSTAPQDWEIFGDHLDGATMSLRHVLAAEAKLMRWSLDDADAILASETRIDPTFAPFVARCEREGASVTILSSGIEPLIQRALARNGVGHVRLLANDVVVSPNGWTMTFRDASDNGHDKALAVRALRAEGMRVVYVGDGHSDFDAALASDVVFAKRGRSLEVFLREKGVPFTPFQSFAQIDRALFPST